MELRTTLFFIYLVIMARKVYSQRTVDLYPFMENNGDAKLERIDDTSTSAINLPTGFNYFGQKYQSIYVNSNGVLSFLRPVTEFFSPEEFDNRIPLGDPRDTTDPSRFDEAYVMIAPFWGNVDISNGGDIYYRYTTTRQIMNTINGDIRTYFPSEQTFEATFAIIVTWDEVSYYGRNPSSSNDNRNTFQAVLVSNNYESFVIFNYYELLWTTGTESGGSSNSGLGELYFAQAGFNAGDGSREHTLPGSGNSRVDDLHSGSNVEVPGRFAFRVDSVSIVEGGCGSSPDLKFYPEYANMIGGQEFFVSGPCYDSNKDYYMRLGESNTEFNCSYYSQARLRCVLPNFYETGWLEVELSDDNGAEYNYRGHYLIEIPSKAERYVNRIDPFNDKWNYAGEALSIEWDQNKVSSSSVSIDVFAYREDRVTPEWEHLVQLSARQPNDGAFTFTPRIDIADVDVGPERSIGAIRVSPSSNRQGRGIWTDVHALGYVLQTDYQEDQKTWATEQCLDWYSKEKPDEQFLLDLFPCPCNLTMAVADFGRYEADPTCDMSRDSTHEDHCGFNPKAKHCVVSIFPSPRGGGSQCCYDDTEELIYFGDDISGGFSSVAHPFGYSPYQGPGRVPTLSYWATDKRAYYYCCVWSENCGYFQELRPTPDCFDYNPPKPASLFGDPHIVTFDGREYSFNPRGEYVLLQNENSPRFDLQGRFQSILTPEAELTEATVLTAIVIKDDGTEAVQVMISPSIGLQVLITGEVIDFGYDVTRIDLTGVTLLTPYKVDRGNPNITEVTIVLQETGIGLKCTAVDNKVINLVLSLPYAYKNNMDFEGILGNWNGEVDDDLREQNGNNLDYFADDRTIYGVFLDEWVVTNVQTDSLFFYGSGRGHEFYQDYSFTPLYTAPGDSNLDEETREQMERLCDGDEYCEFDVLITKSIDIGRATKYAYEQHWSYANATEKGIICPNLPKPKNGSKWFSSDMQHNHLYSILKFYCDDGYTMIGNWKRVCELAYSEDTEEYYGKWRGIEQENDCLLFGSCPELPWLKWGAYEYDENEDMVRVTCLPGWNLYGSKERRCVNGRWSGDESECYDILPTKGIIGLCVGLGVVLIIVIVVTLVVLYNRRQEKYKEWLRETGQELKSRPEHKHPPPEIEEKETTGAESQV